MTTESDESGNEMGEVVPFVRGDARAVRHDELIKIRCFELWGSLAARNCAHVARLLAAELDGLDVKIPDRRTIQEWAQREEWGKQADEEWRSTEDWTVEQMRAHVLANALLAEKNRHDIQMGLYEGREMHAAVLLKAGELSDRKQERVLPLSAIRPREKPKEIEDMPRDEAEAHARALNVRRKTAR
jgi:hypothetical protein